MTKYKKRQTWKTRPSPKGAGRPFKVTKESDRKKISELYAGGHPLIEIAQIYKIDVTTVREIARSYGVPMRPVGRPRKTVE